MPTTAPVKPGQAKPAQQQAAARPFRVGVQTTDEIDYDVQQLLDTSTHDQPVLSIPAAGFLQDLYILVTTPTPAVGAATLNEDFPFNVLDTVSFEDVNNAPIVGPITGWDLYVINKYGGYTFSDDPRLSPVYNCPATGLSIQFVLRVPVELVKRDALGALPNKSGSAQFKLRLRVAATGVIYSAPPATSQATIRIRVEQADWWEPDPTDLKGRPQSQNPPAVQTTQYWSKVDYTVAVGSLRQKFDRVGYLIRNLVVVLRDTGGTTTRRSNGEGAFPDPFLLRVEANTLITRLKLLWQQRMYNNGYHEGVGATIADNYTGAAPLASSKDNGVYVEPFCLDFAHKPGWETRRGYLATSSQARVEAQGTIQAVGTSPYTLSIITNDVAPANGDDAAIAV